MEVAGATSVLVDDVLWNVVTAGCGVASADGVGENLIGLSSHRVPQGGADIRRVLGC